MDEADLTIAAVIRQARILLWYTQMQVAEFADIKLSRSRRAETTCGFFLNKYKFVIEKVLVL